MAKSKQDYRITALTTTIPVIGFISGYIAHKKFNPLFSESQASDNWLLPARYSVGYTSILFTYMLVAILQSMQHKSDIPLWRRMVDFVMSGFFVGCGVMFGRLFG